MTPHPEETILFRSSQQLPRLRLGPLKGFFELTCHPSRALDLPRALFPELNRIKDTIRGVALGAKVLGHRKKQLPKTFIVRLLRTNFFTDL